jgi:hypothetical protein
MEKIIGGCAPTEGAGPWGYRQANAGIIWSEYRFVKGRNPQRIQQLTCPRLPARRQHRCRRKGGQLPLQILPSYK